MNHKGWDSEKFIELSKKVHGDLYDYSSSKYVKYHDKIDIICRIHGVFKQRVKHHLTGSGCKKCSGEKLKQKFSPWTEEKNKILIENYDILSAKNLRKIIGLSKTCIYKQIKFLNLKRKDRRLHHSIPNYLWNNLIRGAKERNLVVDININDVWEMFLSQNKKCKLSGWDITFNHKHEINTASVDRINSDKGYTKENIQIVHKNINRFKMDFTQSEMLFMCKSIVENIKNSNVSRTITDWEIDEWNDTIKPKYM